MRFYNTRFRIVLYAAVMISVIALLASTGNAQVATTQAAPVKSSANVLSIILENLDFVFGIIAILSIAGVSFIIQGFIQSRTASYMPEGTVNLLREMLTNRRIAEAIEFTEKDPSFLSRILNPALRKNPNAASMKEALETAAGEQTADRFRRIEYLNIIGNLGPLLGLLGTVLGMIGSFQGVASAGGQADVSVLSAGISKALAHTFLGLFLAVPCLGAFGVLRTLVDRLTVRASMLAEELLNIVIKPQEAARPAVPTATPIPRPTPAAV